MRILLDTDILLDLALARDPHADSAGELLDLLEQAPGSAFVAWHSLSNFYYLVRGHRGPQETKKFLSDLMRFTQVAPTTTNHLWYAFTLPLKDFEDAMQVAAASASGADIIATRNLRDFRKSPIRAASPKTILNLLRKT